MPTTTNWFTAGTGANVDRSSYTAWTNPGNVTAEDVTYANVNLGKNASSDWLTATNFGFDGAGGVPSDAASINGIEMRFKCYGSSGTDCGDSAIYLLDSASAQQGDNKTSSTKWPTSNNWRELYGSSTDAWNASLDAADIRSANFGVRISANNSNFTTARDFYVDCVQIRITYLAAGEDFPVSKSESVTVTESVTVAALSDTIEVTALGGAASQYGSSINSTSTAQFGTGDYVIVCVADSSDDSSKTIACSGATFGTFTRHVLASNSNGAYAEIWSARCTKGNSTAAVATIGGLGMAYKAAAFYKVRGLAQADVFDASNGGTGTGTDASSGASAALAQSNELAIGCVGVEEYTGDTTGSWTTGAGNVSGNEQTYRVTGASDGMGVYSAAEIVSAKTAQTAAVTGFTSRDWAAVVGTFKGYVTGDELAALTVSVSDSASATDTPTASALSLDRLVSDNASISDAPTVEPLSLVASVQDAASVADAASVEPLSLAPSLSDSATVQDMPLVEPLALAVTVSDSASVSESVTVEQILAPLEINIADTVYAGSMRGLQFNGTSTVIDCGTDASIMGLEQDQTFTVRIWWQQPHDWDVDEKLVLVSQGEEYVGGWVVYAKLRSDGRFDVYFSVARPGGSWFQVYTTKHHRPWQPGHWTAIAATCHTTFGYPYAAICVDNRSQSTSTSDFTPVSSTEPLRFGAQGGATPNYLKGALAWVEISSIYRYIAEQYVGYWPLAPDADVVGSWVFDETSGDTVYDDTTYENDGTITDGTWGIFEHENITIGFEQELGPVSDATGLTDTPSVTLVDWVDASATESIGVADTPNVSLDELAASASDAVGVADTPSAVLPDTLNSSVLDTTTVTDSPVLEIALALSASDSTTIEDTPAIEPLALVLAVAEATSVADAPAVTLPEVGAISLSVQDEANCSDTPQSTISLPGIIVSDTLTVTDTPNVLAEEALVDLNVEIMVSNLFAWVQGVKVG